MASNEWPGYELIPTSPVPQLNMVHKGSIPSTGQKLRFLRKRLRTLTLP